MVVISAGFAEVGAEGARASARAARGLPPGRDATGRAQLPRRRQHAAGVQTERDLLALACRAGKRRVHLAERGARAGLHRAPRRSRPRACRRSRRWETRPTSHGNDLLEYWESDPGTDVVAALPRVVRRSAALRADRAPGRPQEADRRGEERPLGGRGAAPPRSHTGAMLAASDVTVDALFRQAGVIRTDTLARAARRRVAARQPAAPRAGAGSRC